MKLLHGDNRELLAGFDDNTFDSVVTDPPYGFSGIPDVAKVLKCWLKGEEYVHGRAGFMRKDWDSFVPGPECWSEVYRVLKPGAFLFAFCSNKMWDILSIALRIAGFENRDTMRHDYGPPAVGWLYGTGFNKGHSLGKQIDALLLRGSVGAKYVRDVSVNERKLVRKYVRKGRVGGIMGEDVEFARYDTLPRTKSAARWEGWRTSIRPAWEVVMVFRKPVACRTIAQNVLKYRVGGMNLAGCVTERSKTPANVVTTHSDLCVESRCVESCPIKLLGEQKGGAAKFYNQFYPEPFLYTAKPSKAERNLGVCGGNNHPTVKPLELCRHLVRLVTRKGGVVLDPFMGSGTIGVAALSEKCDFVGVELDRESFDVAAARLYREKFGVDMCDSPGYQFIRERVVCVADKFVRRLLDEGKET